MQTDDGPKVQETPEQNILERLFRLIDKIQTRIGNGAMVHFSASEDTLRFKVYWLDDRVTQSYQYQFPIEDLMQFRADNGAENFLVEYLSGLSRTAFENRIREVSNANPI